MVTIVEEDKKQTTSTSTVGGMTTIDGESVLVTPEGEVVGSTTPEVFSGGGGGGSQPSPDTIGGQSTPTGEEFVTPKGEVVARVDPSGDIVGTGPTRDIREERREAAIQEETVRTAQGFFGGTRAQAEIAIERGEFERAQQQGALPEAFFQPSPTRASSTPLPEADIITGGAVPGRIAEAPDPFIQPERTGIGLGTAFRKSGRAALDFGVIGQQGVGAFVSGITDPFRQVGSVRAERVVGLTTDPELISRAEVSDIELGFRQGGGVQIPVPGGGTALFTQSSFRQDTTTPNIPLTFGQVAVGERAAIAREAGVEFRGEPARVIPQRIAESKVEQLRPEFQQRLDVGAEEIRTTLEGQVARGELTPEQAQASFGIATKEFSKTLTEQFRERVGAETKEITTELTPKIISSEQFSRDISKARGIEVVETGTTVATQAAFLAAPFAGKAGQLGLATYEAVRVTPRAGRLALGDDSFGTKALLAGDIALSTGIGTALGVTARRQFFRETRGIIVSDIQEAKAIGLSPKAVKLDDDGIRVFTQVRRQRGTGELETFRRTDVFKTGPDKFGITTKAEDTIKFFDPGTEKFITQTTPSTFAGRVRGTPTGRDVTTFVGEGKIITPEGIKDVPITGFSVKSGESTIGVSGKPLKQTTVVGKKELARASVFDADLGIAVEAKAFPKQTTTTFRADEIVIGLGPEATKRAYARRELTTADIAKSFRSGETKPQDLFTKRFFRSTQTPSGGDRRLVNVQSDVLLRTSEGQAGISTGVSQPIKIKGFGVTGLESTSKIAPATTEVVKPSKLPGSDVFNVLKSEPSEFAGTGRYELTSGTQGVLFGDVGKARSGVSPRLLGGQPPLIKTRRRTLDKPGGIKPAGLEVVRPGVGVGIAPTSITGERQPLGLGIRPSVTLGQSERLKPAADTALKLRSVGFPSLTTVNPVVNVPPSGGRFGFPFALPSFSLNQGSLGAVRGTRKVGRTPSFLAGVLDITAPAPVSGELSGLVVRPIIKKRKRRSKR